MYADQLAITAGQSSGPLPDSVKKGSFLKEASTISTMGGTIKDVTNAVGAATLVPVCREQVNLKIAES